MPATIEAVFVLLIFLAPGFIAVQVKNSLLPYRVPSAFQEAVEAVWFKNHGAIGGTVRLAGVSPSGRQLFLAPNRGEPESLVRFNHNGMIIEDLSEKTEGVWIDVGAEIVRIEIFS